MDARNNVAERRVNRTVAGNPRLALKGAGADTDVEMALATVLVTCMATVAFAVIHDVKLMRIKG